MSEHDKEKRAQAVDDASTASTPRLTPAASAARFGQARAVMRAVSAGQVVRLGARTGDVRAMFPMAKKKAPGTYPVLPNYKGAEASEATTAGPRYPKTGNELHGAPKRAPKGTKAKHKYLHGGPQDPLRQAPEGEEAEQPEAIEPPSAEEQAAAPEAGAGHEEAEAGAEPTTDRTTRRRSESNSD